MKKHSRFQATALVALCICALIICAPIASAHYTDSPRTENRSASQIPAELIFQQSADAVFMIETFDAYGGSIRTGSGFFISETGFAVTNLHVVDGAERAIITLYNGDVHPVRGYHAFDEEFNLVIISVDSDEGGWEYLTLADSDQIEAGNSIYVIGSPLGYINTMTGGIISHTRRTVDDETFIQFTAPISFGSGGSPMLNAYGQVVGVASSSFSYGQNLNLAVPINHVKDMQPGEAVSLSSLRTG